jgi:hypothetical protein
VQRATNTKKKITRVNKTKIRNLAMIASLEFDLPSPYAIYNRVNSLLNVIRHC